MSGKQTPSSPFVALGSPSAWARFVLTAAVGLAIDQWSKVFAFAKLAGPPDPAGDDGRVHFSSRTYEFIPHWLHFHVTANQGAVFGLGQGWRLLFISVSLAAILFVLYLFATSGRQRLYQVVLGILVAGVLGNLYDRVKFGYVRDMIYALPKWDYFPWIFNVADTLLCVGVGLMIVYSFFHSPAAPEHAAVGAEATHDADRSPIPRPRDPARHERAGRG
jgi:signal peptidase II